MYAIMLCHCAECHALFTIMLYVVMLSVVMLNVIMLNVVAPFNLPWNLTLLKIAQIWLAYMAFKSLMPLGYEMIIRYVIGKQSI